MCKYKHKTKILTIDIQFSNNNYYKLNIEKCSNLAHIFSYRCYNYIAHFILKYLNDLNV